jgi:hypothetical protein
MKLIRLLLGLACVTSAGLFGNWVGEQFREKVIGQKGHSLTVTRTGPEGETLVALNPLLTNLLPALLGAALGRPRWVNAFIYGAAASAFLGDQYEKRFFEFLKTGR